MDGSPDNLQTQQKGKMLASRASSMVRQVSLRTQVMSQRQMAIASTVEKAVDTSGQEFAAPSHVSLATQASEMAQQLSAFYSNPGKYMQKRGKNGQLRTTTDNYGHLRTTTGKSVCVCL